MSEPRQPEAVNDSLRERLQELLKTHSQAEIARRTGHSLSNVNRYVTGTRMPGSFLAALVTELGVNANWLLTGDGEPLKADIGQTAGKQANELLEIMEAMTAVANMRIGTLTTRHHLRVLRDLNESLERHEQLQQRLNKHSRELFSQMIDDLNNALENLDLDRAERIRETAKLVAGLCDDYDLNYEFLNHQARIEFGKGRSEKAAEHLRQQFRLAIMRKGELDQREVESVTRYAITMASLNREAQALRIMRAALALLSDSQLHWTSAHYLQFGYGHYSMLAGDLRNGMALMQRHYPALANTRWRQVGETYLTVAMLYAEVLTVDQALIHGSDNEPKAKWIMDYACVLEDTELLARAVKYYDTPPIQPVKGQRGRTEASRILLKAMQGDAKAALKEWAQFEKTLRNDPVVQLHAGVVRGQILRAARQWKRALEVTLDNQRALDALDPELTLGMQFNARHHRSVLALKENGLEVPDEAVSKAHAFFRRYHDGGYAVFRPWIGPDRK